MKKNEIFLPSYDDCCDVLYYFARVSPQSLQYAIQATKKVVCTLFSSNTYIELSKCSGKIVYSTRPPSRKLQMVIKGPWRYSSDDWLQCLYSLPTSRILKRVKYNILFLTLWTAFWTYFFTNSRLGLNFIKSLNFPASVHSILGTALGLLLVFRTNTSYDRFWEGRKLWGSLVVASRDIAMHTYIHLGKKYHKKIANLLVSYLISLKQHIQGETIRSEFKPFLNNDDCKEEFEKAITVRNSPNYLLRCLAVEIHKALHESNSDPIIATLHEQGFTSSMHSMASAAASCERIVKQPVPLAYARHTSRFLSIYLLTLPLTLIPTLGWATVPTMTAICWSFLSVHDIGLFIEDPFNKDFQIIPLNQFVCVARSDIAGSYLQIADISISSPSYSHILEILDGVMDSPELEKFDMKMLTSMKEKSRMQDDNYFAYY